MASGEQAVVSLSDIWLLTKRHSLRLLLAALVGTLLFASWAAARTPTYSARATFRDRPSASTGFSRNLTDLIIASSVGGSDSTRDLSDIMLSRALLERPISALSLQAVITPLRANPNSLLGRVGRNLKIELSRLRGRSRLPITDPDLPIACKDLSFHGEIPECVTLKFVSEEEFDLYAKGRKPLMRGRLDERIECPPLHGVVVRQSDLRLKGRSFRILLLPLQEVVEAIGKRTKIGSVQDKSNLIEVVHRHPDRHQAAAIANLIINAYLTSLRDQCSRRAQEQLSYLELRQTEMLAKLKQFMVDNATQLSDSLGSGHFLDLESEASFLAEMKGRYEGQLLQNDLELKFLEMMDGGDNRFCDLHLQSESIKDLLQKLQEFHHQREALDFALKSSDSPVTSSKERSFHLQLTELQRLQRETEEIQILLACLESNTALPSSLAVVDCDEGLISSWLSRLNESQQNLLVAKSAEGRAAMASEWEQEKSNFVAYLHNQLHTSAIRTRIIQDRLAYQQDLSSQFEGVDLETSQALYLKYSEELDQIQRKIRQFSYVLDHIHDPDFEVSSLSASLSDMVSCEMIRSTTATLLMLSDEHNRSEKERARLRHQLELQRGFIAEHIAQIIDLNKDHEQLIREKLRAVQEVKLDLLHQNVSILERELGEYIASRKKTLRHEHILYDQHLKELHAHMSHLPEKWLAEKEVELCMEMAVGMVESLTEMVESKNIAHNLDVVESEPLDLAIPPTIPNSPHLLLFSLLGALVGGGAAFASLTLSMMGRGFPASPEGLAYLGLSVAGRLDGTPVDETNLSHHNVEVLRKMISPLERCNEHTMLVATGTHNALPFRVAELLAKRGERVLLIDCSLRRGGEYATATLIQYLEGHVEAVQPVQRKEYDYLPSGGASRFAPELLSSHRFARLIKWATEKYDIVIFATEAGATQAETELLLRNASHAVIALEDETTYALQPLFELAKERKVTFYFRPIDPNVLRPRWKLRERFNQGRLWLQTQLSR